MSRTHGVPGRASSCVNNALTLLGAGVHPLGLTPAKIAVSPKNTGLTLKVLGSTLSTNPKKARRRRLGSPASLSDVSLCVFDPPCAIWLGILDHLRLTFGIRPPPALHLLDHPFVSLGISAYPCASLAIFVHL